LCSECWDVLFRIIPLRHGIHLLVQTSGFFGLFEIKTDIFLNIVFPLQSHSYIQLLHIENV